MATNQYKSNTPRIVAGNDFTLSIMVYVPNYEDVETNGRFKPLDLSLCTDISVSLVCGKHTTIIPLQFELAEEQGLILAYVEEYQVHEGAKYGIEVKGKTADGQDWRWYLSEKEGIYITNSTSQSNMVAGVANRKLDLYARVGFCVPVPEIDPTTNHWLVGDYDTGVSASGKDGDTPYVGDNGNWWIGDEDTGVLAYRDDFVTSNVSDCVIKFVDRLPVDAASHPNTIYITPTAVDYLHYSEMTRYVATALADYRTDAQNEEKYLQITDAASTYLTIEDAEDGYLSKSDANDTYLKKAVADGKYLTPTAADLTYLRKVDAQLAYITQSGAADIYLSKNAAAQIYWTVTGANNVFLKKYEAAATYATLEDLQYVADHIVDLTGYATKSWVNSNYMPSYTVDAFYVKKSDLQANYFNKQQTIELIEAYISGMPTGPVTPTGPETPTGSDTPTGTTPTGTTPTGGTPTGTTPTGGTPTGTTPTGGTPTGPIPTGDELPANSTMRLINRSISGTVAIPTGTQSIGPNKFAYCNLQAIFIPRSVVKIEDMAFYNTSVADTIFIPDSVGLIGQSALSVPSGTTITFESLTPPQVAVTTGYWTANPLTPAWNNTTIYVPESAVNAYKTATGFSAVANRIFGTSNTLAPNVDFPQGRDLIIENKLYSVNSANISYEHEGVDYISYADKLVTGTMQENLVSMSDTIEHVMVPTGITAIGVGAFFNCTNLTDVTIGGQVDTIGNLAFDNCGNNIEITFYQATPPQNVSDNAFSDVSYIMPTNMKIYVREGYGQVWKQDYTWSRWADHIYETTLTGTF